MMNLIKSAEVYGSEAIVYTGSNAPPDLYIDLIVNNKLEPGMGSGSMYGKGVYTTYNLSGTATDSGSYGNFIYKLKVNLYGFISFNPDITRKIYGEDLTPSQQYEKIYGKRDHIFKGLRDLESKERFSRFSSDLADPASKFLRGRVKGLIFTGRSDGDVAVIYDPSTIVPIAWKETRNSSWSSFDKDQIKPAIGRGVSGSFEKSKYEEVDVSRDRGAKESINILSNFHGDNPGKREIASINYLIDNAPVTFLSNYSEKDWAKNYIRAAVDRSLFVISQEEFLKKFKDQPWFEDNCGSVVKRYSESNPYNFLLNFSNQPWAQPYIHIEAESYANKDPFNFLNSFSNEPWAETYLSTAAEKLANKEPYYFLNSFSNEPWAQPYLPTAAESYAKKEPRYFLSDFSNEPWAQGYIPAAVKIYAESDLYYFLSDFSNEPWAKPYLSTAAEKMAKKDPYWFLSKLSKEDWAEPYLSTAAEKMAKKDPYWFLINFSKKDWAETYLSTAAEGCAKEEPDDFLKKFINEPWAQPYLELARNNISKENQDPILPIASDRSAKILKLSKALLSLGHIKEMSAARSLATGN